MDPEATSSAADDVQEWELADEELDRSGNARSSASPMTVTPGCHCGPIYCKSVG